MWSCNSLCLSRYDYIQLYPQHSLTQCETQNSVYNFWFKRVLCYCVSLFHFTACLELNAYGYNIEANPMCEPLSDHLQVNLIVGTSVGISFILVLAIAAVLLVVCFVNRKHPVRRSSHFASGPKYVTLRVHACIRGLL